MLQQGAPTLNTMVKFTKIAKTEEDQLSAISHTLTTKDGYVLDPMQTHLTSAEWFNVDASQEFGVFAFYFF